MAIKKKIYLTLIIFSLLIILIIVFVIFPLFRGIKNNSKELIVQKEKFVALEEKITNLEKFKVLYAELQHFLKEIDNLFVDSGVPVEFISFLEKTSEKSQLKIEILPTSDKKMEKDFWPFLTFQITSTGSFTNFLKFLEKLENGLYLVEVQNVSISKLTGDNDIVSDNVRANFSVKVFVK
ncbi:MAG: type 4a pilus biogenesis protein PilO [Candidatus Nealsonbacteria bacterium]|nr:type 4a pilus biogenesis protein PilO [Candidatus Nealsonbacteria bacterium]